MTRYSRSDGVRDATEENATVGRPWAVASMATMPKLSTSSDMSSAGNRTCWHPHKLGEYLVIYRAERKHVILDGWRGI